MWGQDKIIWLLLMRCLSFIPLALRKSIQLENCEDVQWQNVFVVPEADEKEVICMSKLLYLGIFINGHSLVEYLSACVAFHTIFSSVVYSFSDRASHTVFCTWPHSLFYIGLIIIWNNSKPFLENESVVGCLFRCHYLVYDWVLCLHC